MLRGILTTDSTNAKESLSRVAKGVLIPPNSEASVSVTISRAGTIYIALHTDSIRIGMALQASGSFNVLPHMPIPRGVAKVLEKPTRVSRRMIVHIKTGLPPLVVHLDQAALLPVKRGRRIILLSKTRLQPYSVK